MPHQVSRARRRGLSLLLDGSASRTVGYLAVALVVAQLAFRAYELYPSWFFLDDYNLLHDATGTGLGASYLLEPYNGHLMPAGRLVVWVVAHVGTLNWSLAATITLAFQAAADVAVLAMLLTLFGRRRMVLVPLALFLSSAIPLPGTVWWAAALNLVPVQATSALAVALWVRHLRTGSRRLLAATIGTVVVGMLFDVKGVLVLPVLAYLALAYFASGSLLRRVRTVVVERWPAVLGGAVVLGAYAAYYLTHVPQILGRAKGSVFGEIAGSMLGTAFTTGVLGGPWRWSDLAPPTAYADPPAWTVHLAWSVIVVVVLYAALRRTQTLKAWGLLAGYLLMLFVLLVDSRGGAFGAVIGLEYRYLTDAAVVVALCLGLAFLPLLGAAEPAALRSPALLRVRVSPSVAVLLVGLLVLGGTWSSVRYVHYWHTDNASDAYLTTLRSDLRAFGSVDLVDQPVPDAVLSSLTAPDNTTERLVDLLHTGASYPDATDRLVVVGPDGGLRTALIQLGVASVEGPTTGCGWRVDAAGLTVPLTGNAFDYSWWARIGYLATNDSPVTVRAGRSTVRTTVSAGVHSLYVKLDGTFGGVRVEGLDPGTSMCVDTVQVGTPVAGGPLS